MKGNIFINKYVMACAISIVIMLVGFISITTLPIEQYPNIAPPTVRVSTSYTGADANTIMKSVVQPLEESINGVPGMTYITSSASASGEVSIQVYFEQGIDPDLAAVNVQNAVRVIGRDEMPHITIIAPDADNHHVINFAADPMIFPQVRIMKETNVKDQFLEVATVNTADGLSYTDLSTNAAQRADRYAVIGIAAIGAETPMSSVHQTLHLTINRGIQDNTWNLIWNQYVGADVVTYNILRGSAGNTLEQIASLSAYNTSYTDESPDAGKPLYAIEFVINAPASSAAPARRVIRKSATLTGKSNVVSSLEARTIIYATAITIHSATETYALSEDVPQLQLLTEILPANATYKNVKW